ncbi:MULTISPECIES: DUF5684 domain-containing protein [unclassified Microbacterium]|uniref:DUF5684 domain-containing protein n=1 Tax=unclassified Microbacterium TaxID=2609290 RepID=UPI0012FD8EB4|nr:MULTISPECIES: DUF5684 domain-containing protein [unclassified Microbacterium]
MDPGFGLLSFFVAVLVYVYHALTLMFIFRKAGLKAWPAWVPLFNVWRLLQLGGQKGWWVLVGLIPVVGTIVYLVFLIIAGINIQTALGKPGVFYLLAIFLTPVWYGILAWDSSTWQPKHNPVVPPSGYEGAPA